MTAQNQPSGANKRHNAQQAIPTAPISVNCTCASQAGDSENKPQGWHKLVTWPEGIATWALILTLAVLIWQAILTRIAARAASSNVELYMSKERARLRIKMKPLVLPSEIDTFNTVDFTVSVYGQTDAFVTDSLCVAYIFPWGVFNNPELRDKIMFPIHSLPSVVSANAPAVNCCALLGTKDGADNILVEEAKARRMFVGVRGFIKYKDVFDRERETAFRYVWRYSEGFGDYGQWEKSGDPQENRET
jgi:hypothetical protein